MKLALVMKQLLLDLFGQSLLGIAQCVDQFGCIAHSNLGGSSRRCCANVGDEVCDGEVDLMPDCRDHRNVRLVDRTCHCFFVECPEVFDRATAATDDQ